MEQDNALAVDAFQGETQSSLPPSTPQVQPLSLEEARQGHDYAAEALSPASPAAEAAAAGVEPTAVPTQETADPAVAIRALREQIQQHRTAHRINPTDLMAQQASERLDAVPALPPSEALSSPTSNPADGEQSIAQDANPPAEATPAPGSAPPGSRDAILESAPDISPEQRDRIRRSAEGETLPAVEPQPAEQEPEAEPETEESAEEAGEPAEEEQAEEEADPRVLVAEVQVEAATGELDEELRAIVYDAIETRPGRTTTRTQLQQDINNVFATGYFAAVDAVPEDTDLGVRVTYVVQPNPVLTDVQVEGNQVLPETVVDEIFADQTGEIINLIEFQDGILELNEWYQERGYVLAQVIAAPEVSDEGVVTLEVAEGVIEEIEVRFLNEEGEAFDEEGNPVGGRTRDFIITREFETEPGDVFNQAQIEQDFQNVFALQIFEDVSPGLEPGDEDPRKVKVIVNVTERNTGSVAAGLGFNFTGDLFGTVSFRQDNFGGNNQKLTAEAQLSTRDILFDISFTDPWIAGDPYGTSYTANAFARRSINLNFDGGPNPINLDNGDRVRIRRIGGGISFSRPLGSGWTASVGTLFQNVSSRDAGGGIAAFDAAGNPLTFSAATGGGGVDDLWTFPLSLSWDQRNDPFNPTSGGILRLNSEQSVPLGRGSIFMNRLRGSYSYYIPVSWINFNDGPQALAFNVQVGTIVGDAPPYEAFALGGTNSIRGYDEGEVGSGRSYAQITAEYRFPLFSFLGAALFVDAGTDLGSGFAIPGAPGPDRGKPGSGLGYGAGLRVQTPLGPLRIDYGFNDQGEGRIHFGIGERF
jgi:outer membrane protein insertion porin family